MNFNPTFFIVGATVSSGKLILTVNGNPAMTSLNTFNIRFAQNVAVPTGYATLPVYIAVGGVNYPVWDKFGNIMLGSELALMTSGTYFCPRRVYVGGVGSQTTSSTSTASKPDDDDDGGDSSSSTTTIHYSVWNFPLMKCTVTMTM
jgi:hypothetical protein